MNEHNQNEYFKLFRSTISIGSLFPSHAECLIAIEGETVEIVNSFLKIGTCNNIATEK